MTTEEQKAVEDAAINQNTYVESEVVDAFIAGAQFLSDLRKPSEELIQTNDVIKMLESIKKDANNLHSGNVAHQKVHIIGGINYLMEEIAKLMQPDVNAELLGALKNLCDVARQYIVSPDDGLDNSICDAMLTVYNYEQKQQIR